MLAAHGDIRVERDVLRQHIALKDPEEGTAISYHAMAHEEAWQLQDALHISFLDDPRLSSGTLLGGPVHNRKLNEKYARGETSE